MNGRARLRRSPAGSPQRFWPGPLTLILKRAPGVSDAVTGGQDTVGLRIPSHPVAHALLEKFGGGIAAPSANRFGRVSATLAEHVRREFGDAVDFVFDGGECDVGIESTIVDATGAAPVLLRPGHITARDIEQAAGIALVGADAALAARAGHACRALPPATPLLVMEGDLLLELAATLTRQGKRSQCSPAARCSRCLREWSGWRRRAKRSSTRTICMRTCVSRCRRLRCVTGGRVAAGPGMGCGQRPASPRCGGLDRHQRLDGADKSAARPRRP